MMNSVRFKTVDQYLSVFPKETRDLLLQLRKTIRQAAPGAEEIISYNMPAYKHHGVLVYFAGYKNHIGFYPASAAVRVYKDELTKFKTSKGTIQFPLDKPVPVTLVKKIVKFRVNENLEKEKLKLLRKKK